MSQNAKNEHLNLSSAERQRRSNECWRVHNRLRRKFPALAQRVQGRIMDGKERDGDAALRAELWEQALRVNQQLADLKVSRAAFGLSEAGLLARAAELKAAADALGQPDVSQALTH